METATVTGKPSHHRTTGAGAPLQAYVPGVRVAWYLNMVQHQLGKARGNADTLTQRSLGPRRRVGT